MILPTRRWRVLFQETSMSSNFERSQLTKIMISSAPVTAETLDSASYLGLSCTIKEVQFTAGQKQDIDVTTLCSVEQENINGLGAASEISMSGNFYLNAAQNALRSAYDNDTTYGFKVIFPSGNGFTFMAEVRQHTWSAGTNGVVAATFSLRLKGKPVLTTEPLKVKVDLKARCGLLPDRNLKWRLRLRVVCRLILMSGRKVVLLFPDRRRQRSVRHRQYPVMRVHIPARFLIQQARLTK